jgi:ATP-binding cassette subfamily B protein
MDKSPAGLRHLFEKSPLRIFASYYRPHWKLFAADMFAASLIAAVDLAFPMMIKYTIEHFLPNGLYKFFFMIALMGIMYLLRMAFTYFITYWGHTAGGLYAELYAAQFDTTNKKTNG